MKDANGNDIPLDMKYSDRMIRSDEPCCYLSVEKKEKDLTPFYFSYPLPFECSITQRSMTTKQMIQEAASRETSSSQKEWGSLIYNEYILVSNTFLNAYECLHAITGSLGALHVTYFVDTSSPSKDVNMSIKIYHGLFTPLLSLLLFLCLFQFSAALWPMPRSLQMGTTLLKLHPHFDIQITGVSYCPPQDLLDAISRTKLHLFTDRLQRLVVGRGANDRAGLVHAPSLARLNLELNPNSPEIKSILEEATKEITTRNEVYSLTVPDTDHGVATLTATSSLGLLRGLTTFEQLWYQLSDTIYSYQAPVQISNDSPAYVRVPTYVVLSIYVTAVFVLFR